MCEEKKELELQIYNKFFIELKRKHNIDKETFYNSNFYPIEYYELDNDVECTDECICGKAIYNIFVLKSDVLNKQIIVGCDCLDNFKKDKKNLNGVFVKKCLLCYNVTIENNHQICDDCQAREKCIKCKNHTPKKNYKVCIFCQFGQKPLNDGKQILGRYGGIPIYIEYGKHGPYLYWLNKTINIPSFYIKDDKITLENAIKSIKYKRQQLALLGQVV